MVFQVSIPCTFNSPPKACRITSAGFRLLHDAYSFISETNLDVMTWISSRLVYDNLLYATPLDVIILPLPLDGGSAAWLSAGRVPPRTPLRISFVRLGAEVFSCDVQETVVSGCGREAGGGIGRSVVARAKSGGWAGAAVVSRGGAVCFSGDLTTT
jgi:hypothetical protein